MSKSENISNEKTTISYIQGHSLWDLLLAVNNYNKDNNNPILKEDIVNIIKEEGTYILLYYK